MIPSQIADVPPCLVPQRRFEGVCGSQDFPIQSKRFWLVETLVANNAVLVGKDNWRNVSPHEAIHLNAMTAEEDFPRNHIKQESAAAGGQKC